MKCVCAWCEKVIDVGDGTTERVTHGICKACKKEWEAEGFALLEKMSRADAGTSAQDTTDNNESSDDVENMDMRAWGFCQVTGIGGVHELGR